jgi:ABC-type sugar transport system ATPase subunit
VAALATSRAAEVRPLLELRGLTKDFPGVRALDGVDLDLGAGEVLGLVGENGAGKSTLIKILGGIHRAGSYGGELVLDGVARRFTGADDARAAGIAVVHQELCLVPEMTVAENLLLGREPRRFGLIDTSRMIAESRRMLDRFGTAAAGIDPESPVASLGVGLQQLVEIARALGTGGPPARSRTEPGSRGAPSGKERGGSWVGPNDRRATPPAAMTRGPGDAEWGGPEAPQARLIVLDEPTAALTDDEAARLFEIVRQGRARGTSFIYISHRLDEIFTLCDRIAVLRDGRHVVTRAAAATDADELVADMIGKELATLLPPEPRDLGDVVLEVAELSAEHESLPGRRVLHELSLAVRAGEVVGLGGAMGSGRTALLSALFGTYRGSRRGRIRVGGRPVLLREPRDAIAAGLALVPEDRKGAGLVLEMTVGENLTLASLGRYSRGLVDDLAEARAAGAEAARLEVRAAALDVEVGTLSGGNQQKVVLGKWLLTGPRVLLLDEPTRGVDVGARAEIYRIVRELVAGGLAVLLASSDLPELRLLCDRILVLREGRLAGELSRAEASEEAILQLSVGRRSS